MFSSDKKIETRLSSQTLYEGKTLKFRRDDIITIKGLRTHRNVLVHPGGAVILPYFENGDILLIRQYRYCIDKVIIELPAGTLEPPEPPLETARRELVEETGYGSDHFTLLGAVYTAPGFCTEKLHLYLAENLYPIENHQFLEDEYIEVVRTPFSKALAMADTGEIEDAKTISSLFLAQRRLGL